MLSSRGILTLLVAFTVAALGAASQAAGAGFSAPVAVPDSGVAPSHVNAARGASAAYVVWDALADAPSGRYEIRLATVRPDRPPDPAEVISAGSGTVPRVAAYDGGAAVVWTDGEGIELVRVSAAGDPSPPVTLTSSVGAAAPQIVAAGSGALTIAYVVRGDRASDARVEAAFVTPANAVTTARVSRSGWIRDLALASAEGRRAVAVWERRTSGGRAQRLETAQLGGGKARDVRRVATNRSRHTLEPRIAVGPSGGATIVWETDTGRRRSPEPDRVGAVRLSPAGIPGKSHVVAARKQNLFAPDVAVDSRGRASVSYLLGPRIRLARLGAGGRVRSRYPMRDGPGRWPDPPSIATDSRDRTVMAWSHCCGKRSNLVASRVSPRGEARGPEVLFAGDAQAFGDPQVASGMGASPVVVWPLSAGVMVSFASAGR
jgi:hypothetical protein